MALLLAMNIAMNHVILSYINCGISFHGLSYQSRDLDKDRKKTQVVLTNVKCQNVVL